MNWYQNKMRPTSARLIKMLTAKLKDLNPDKSPKTIASVSARSSGIEAELKAMERLVESLNVNLEGRRYFGDQMSIADILYYSEISTVTFLSGK